MRGTLPLEGILDTALEAGELSRADAAKLIGNQAIVEEAHKRLHDGRARVRRNSALVLSLLPELDADSCEQLAIAVKDSDDLVRGYAIQAFAGKGVGREVAIVPLVQALDDDSESTTLTAIAGLVYHLEGAPSASYRKAIAALGNGSLVTQISLSEAFSKLGNPAIVNLTAALGNPSGHIKKWARSTLRAFGAAAINTLIEALGHARLRDMAVRVLEGMDSFEDGHIPVLGTLAGGNDAATQAAAIRVLKAVQKVLERRRQKPAEVINPAFYKRFLDAQEIQDCAEHADGQALLWNLRDARAYVRINTMSLLAALGITGMVRARALTAMKPMTRDTDKLVRLSVATYGPTIGGADAAPLLGSLTKDAERSVRHAARKALIAIAANAPDALESLLRTSKDLALLDAAVNALVTTGKPGRQVARKLLRGGGLSTTRRAAVMLLERSAEREDTDVRALTNALGDQSPRVRLASAAALGQVVRDDDTVWATLQQVARGDGNAMVRRAAALSADLVRGRGPKPKVMPPAELPFPAFETHRLTAAQMEAKRKALVPAKLMGLRTSGRAEVRHNVAVATGLLGTNDADTVRWLVVCLRDTDPGVCSAAARSLGMIDAPALDTVPPMAALLLTADGALEAALFEGLMSYAHLALSPMLEGVAGRTHIQPETVQRLADAVDDALILALARHLYRPSSYAMRQLTADVLAAIGPRAVAAQKDLLDVLDDPLGRLRAKVVRAVGRVCTPTVAVYEELLMIGNNDARLSVRAETEVAIDALVNRLDAKQLATIGGVEAQKDVWLKSLVPSAAHVRR
ncbi:MAG: HEAT repeat protein [Myxococcota bacterium]|jgi:HEAT repeat protein